MNLLDLPTEILWVVVHYLSPADKIDVAWTSRRLFDIATTSAAETDDDDGIFYKYLTRGRLVIDLSLDLSCEYKGKLTLTHRNAHKVLFQLENGLLDDVWPQITEVVLYEGGGEPVYVDDSTPMHTLLDWALPAVLTKVVNIRYRRHYLKQILRATLANRFLMVLECFLLRRSDKWFDVAMSPQQVVQSQDHFIIDNMSKWRFVIDKFDSSCNEQCPKGCPVYQPPYNLPTNFRTRSACYEHQWLHALRYRFTGLIVPEIEVSVSSTLEQFDDTATFPALNNMPHWEREYRHDLLNKIHQNDVDVQLYLLKVFLADWCPATTKLSVIDHPLFTSAHFPTHLPETISQLCIPAALLSTDVLFNLMTIRGTNNIPASIKRLDLNVSGGLNVLDSLWFPNVSDLTITTKTLPGLGVERYTTVFEPEKVTRLVFNAGPAHFVRAYSQHQYDNWEMQYGPVYIYNLSCMEQHRFLRPRDEAYRLKEFLDTSPNLHEIEVSLPYGDAPKSKIIRPFTPHWRGVALDGNPFSWQDRLLLHHLEAMEGFATPTLSSDRDVWEMASRAMCVPVNHGDTTDVTNEEAGVTTQAALELAPGAWPAGIARSTLALATGMKHVALKVADAFVGV